MKAWQINLLAVGIFFAVMFSVPDEYTQISGYTMVLLTTFWVYFDSRKLNVEKYKASVIGINNPFWVAFIVFTLWIIAFPIYITWRQDIINGKCPLEEKRVGDLKKVTIKSLIPFFIATLVVTVLVLYLVL